MRTRYRKILVAAALTALALTAIFATAANAATPPAPYQDFAGCPSPAENDAVASCEKLVFTGGHISFGNRNMPISTPITMVGGFEQVTGNYLFNAEGGIVPTRETIPGGVIGMTGLKWLDTFSEKALKLYGVVELAGTPGSVFDSVWPVPVKIHLESPLLGKGCYIGSNASPINLNLTVGTTDPPAPNVPISGHPSGELTPEAGRPAVEVSADGALVDNSYAVPAASGCKIEAGGLTIPVDSLVNQAYHLPAAAGTNETILDFDVSYVPSFVVYG